MKINRKISKYNNSPRNGNDIKYLVVHYVGAVSTAKNNADYFNGGDRQASAHYFVDDTSIYQIVEDSRASWHCGGGRQSSKGGTYLGKCTNLNSIGIEMCCKKDKKGKLYISDATKANTALLVQHLMKKHGIPASCVIRHFDVNGKNCPGGYCTATSWKKLKTLLVGSIKTNSTKVKYKKSNYAKKIKTYLKKTGYFDGKVDAYVTPEYTEAIKTIQNKYFKRKQDRDGLDGPDTLILAHNIYNFRGIKHFRLDESGMRCTCGHCTGYPAVIDRQLLLNMDAIRAKYGAITVTSCLRCTWYNNKLSGSIKNSKHLTGDAMDWFNKTLTSTKEKRNATVKMWYSYKKANYAYANTTNMGNCVHTDVKGD